MRVRDWQDILSDVTDSDHDPDGWRAVAGQRRQGIGEDVYFGHPQGGLYHIKTYAKNPYELHGVGTRVARRIDDEIEPLLPRRADNSGRFAVRRPPKDESDAKSMATKVEETVAVHANAPTTADDFFTDIMEAVNSPAFGPMEYEQSERPERLDGLSETFEEAEALLTSELDDLIDAEDVGRGFQ